MPSVEITTSMLLLAGPARRESEPLLQTPFDERNAAISPDGRWMAYDSTESGQSQIYVRPFPNVADARYQISTGGGRTPAWAPDGHDLFFVNRTEHHGGDGPVDADLQRRESRRSCSTRPSILLDGRFIGPQGRSRTYDVSRDGQRFLMIKENAGSSEGNAPPASMIVVQNWFEELKAKVAAGK